MYVSCGGFAVSEEANFFHPLESLSLFAFSWTAPVVQPVFDRSFASWVTSMDCRPGAQPLAPFANDADPDTPYVAGCDAQRVAEDAPPDLTMSSREGVHDHAHVSYSDTDADTICFPCKLAIGKCTYERATTPPPLYVPARSSVAVE